jgi:hypothetical protein
MTDTTSPSHDLGHGRALIAACLIVAAGAVMGLAAGLTWAAVAPRVVYQVYTLNPPTAYAINPETSAFIATDGWYCLLAVLGGGLIGLLGYVFGVRRYGPVPMAGTILGATGAAFIAQWLGHRQSGGPGFNHLLATSKPGTLLHAPISLGSQGALAFWPLAAAAVAGGIELIGVLRARRQAAFNAEPVPGMDSFALRPGSAGPAQQPSEPGHHPSAPGSPNGQHQPGAEDCGGSDTSGDDAGRAAL